MIVRHLSSSTDPATCTAKSKVWVYRTEVENDNDYPIRVIWFEFHYFDTCHDGGQWFGVNARNRPLRTSDFIDWYGDAESPSNGWIQPGSIAVCDPNYHLAFGSKLIPAKWSYLAVDAGGSDYFAEAEVEERIANLYDPNSE